jgi:CheY-like chemotaxis protein
VVDGRPGFRRRLCSLFEEAGLEAAAAADCREGLLLACATRPSTIVAHLQLPDAGGLDLALLVRWDPALAGTRIVLLGDDEEPMRHGADRFLRCPVDPDELLDFVLGHSPRRTKDERPAA